MLRVLADQNLYQLNKFIPSGVKLNPFNPSDGLPEDWHQYDALLIRTVTNIDEKLFKEIDHCSIQFIGSGSAGFDHVDLEVLEERNIRFSHAAGCNARSVAEYVTTAMLLWSEQREINLKDQHIGIVGVGNVGSALAQLLDKLCLSLNLYDPPRHQRNPSFTSCSLKSLLDSDIITLHTPLTRKGDYPTHHWLNADKLRNDRFKLVLNTARGGIIDEKALINAFNNNKIGNYILDVWEGEPRFNDRIAQNALFRTPHIAGYSHQAKLRASRIICGAMADHFNLPDPPPVSAIPNQEETGHTSEKPASLSEILMNLHPIREYQEDLTQLIGLPDNKKEKRFAQIRTNRAFRQEFRYIRLPAKLLEEYPVLKLLGMKSI